MLDRFKEVISSEYPALFKAKLYLAISGGKDSMTLSHLLTQCEIPHTLLHCNFQLRGKESDADESFIRNYAEKNQLALHVKSFDTNKASEDFNMNIQETARKLRYDWFDEFLKEGAYLLTAHHLDDSIETFFINLMRGTGLKGLGGIQSKTDKILRPLSRFSTEDIFHYIDDNQIDYCKDSSNSSNKYRRNRIRNTILPQLLETEPQLKKKMRSLMEDLSESNLFIEKTAQDFRANHFEKIGNNHQVSLKEIQKQEDIFVLYIFKKYGIQRSQKSAWKNFLTRETGAKFHTATFDFIIARDNLIFSKKSTDKSIEILIDYLPFRFKSDTEKVEILSKAFEKINKTNRIQQFDLSKIKLPLTLRNWKQGDKIQALGMQGKKLISDILIDKKLNQFEKASVLVLVDCDTRIIAVLGLVVSEICKIDENTKEILELNIS